MTNEQPTILAVGDQVKIASYPNTGRTGRVLKIERRPFALDYLVAVDGMRVPVRTWHSLDELTIIS